MSITILKNERPIGLQMTPYCIKRKYSLNFLLKINALPLLSLLSFCVLFTLTAIVILLFYWIANIKLEWNSWNTCILYMYAFICICMCLCMLCRVCAHFSWFEHFGLELIVYSIVCLLNSSIIPSLHLPCNVYLGQNGICWL